MKHTRRAALGVLLLATLVSVRATPAGEPPPLSNVDIVTLVQAGIETPLIVDRVRESANAFDLSNTAVIALKENGVPDDVIAAMLASSARSVSSVAAPPAPQDGFSLPTALRPPPTPAIPPDFASPPPAPPPFAQMGGGSQGGGFSAPPTVTGTAQPAGVASARYQEELAAIAAGSPENRRAAMAWMLANRNDTLGLLRQSMKDPRPEIQAAAIYALGELKDRDSIPELRLRIANPSPLVRQNAAEALAGLDDVEGIAAAEQALRQPIDPLDGFIRLVGSARLVRASADLAAILADNPSAANRAAAAWALAEIGRPGTVAWPAIAKALAEDGEPSVRREAARAVASFHDPSSAALLRNACRKDPEVRKVTLQAMSEYPETVEFLITVMHLGAEQIAADELETARVSLHKLTGQDFGMDGQRWSDWFAQNKSRFAEPAVATTPPAVAAPVTPSLPLPPPGGSVPAAPAQGQSILDSLPGALSTSVAGTAGNAEAGNVDIAKWGIVADPSDIPMAPEVDGGGRPRPGLPPGLGGGSSNPMALSSNDFDDGGDSFPSVGTGMRTWRSGLYEDEPPRPAAPQPSAPPPPARPAWPNGGLAGAPAGETFSAPPPPPAGVSLPLPPMTGADPFMQDMGMLSSPQPAAAPATDAAMLPYDLYDTTGAVPYDTPTPSFGPTVSGPIDTSVYAQSATYADDIHVTNTVEGTADLVPANVGNHPTYIFTDPALSPETAAVPDPSSSYPDAAAGGAVPPPLPGVSLPLPGMAGATGADDEPDDMLAFPGDNDAFGLGDPLYDEDGAFPVPPPGGGVSRMEVVDDEDDDFDGDDFADAEMTPETAANRVPRGESAIVSGKVGESDAATKPRRKKKKRRAADSPKSTTAKKRGAPPPGASVYIPEADDKAAKKPARKRPPAARKPAPPSGDVFEPVDAPAGAIPPGKVVGVTDPGDALQATDIDIIVPSAYDDVPTVNLSDADETTEPPIPAPEEALPEPTPIGSAPDPAESPGVVDFFDAADPLPPPGNAPADIGETQAESVPPAPAAASLPPPPPGFTTLTPPEPAPEAPAATPAPAPLAEPEIDVGTFEDGPDPLAVEDMPAAAPAPPLPAGVIGGQGIAPPPAGAGSTGVSEVMEGFEEFGDDAFLDFDSALDSVLPPASSAQTPPPVAAPAPLAPPAPSAMPPGADAAQDGAPSDFKLVIPMDVIEHLDAPHLEITEDDIRRAAEMDAEAAAGGGVSLPPPPGN